jgi:PqqD family protein of HPr-rel-A system
MKGALQAPGGVWVQSWPDEDCAAVFAEGRTSTHLVSALAAEVLRRLQASPATEAQLLAEWIETGDDAAGGSPTEFTPEAEADAVAAALGHTISGLLQAGLLRRVE